ncbi:hypothetical protein [Nocardioides terrisoli]|uniref:hypothetical protein n=1 Tax=Nocardioides terrisoli TaxID=3388267 RepID=UPI00287BB9AB|nr:hypothetical protein [Nocardioides marmorisolisilvae]
MSTTTSADAQVSTPYEAPVTSQVVPIEHGGGMIHIERWPGGEITAQWRAGIGEPWGRMVTVGQAS